MVLKLRFLDFYHISSYVTRLDPGHLPPSTGEPQWAQNRPHFGKISWRRCHPPPLPFQLDTLRYVLHIWNLAGLCSSFVTQTAVVVAAMASIIAKCSIESADKIKNEGWGFDHQKRTPQWLTPMLIPMISWASEGLGAVPDSFWDSSVDALWPKRDETCQQRGSYQLVGLLFLVFNKMSVVL